MINGGFGLVLDGSDAAERRAKLMLSWDVNNGVRYLLLRHIHNQATTVIQPWLHIKPENMSAPSADMICGRLPSFRACQAPTVN